MKEGFILKIPIEELQKVLNLYKVKEESISRGYLEILELVNKEIAEYEKFYHFVILNNCIVSDN